MAKMKLALQRVDDGTSYEKEIDCEASSEAVQAAVADMNANRGEGGSEVRLLSAWQITEDGMPIPAEQASETAEQASETVEKDTEE